MSPKSILRSMQSLAPFVRPFKFEAYNFCTRHFGRPLEPEFRLLCGLQRASLALDIGGNWGQSICALKHTARPHKIIAFEPNATLARRLENRFAADGSVEIRPVALSDSKGAFSLYIPWYAKYLYDGLASLDYDEVKNWFTYERFAWFDPDKLRIDRITVETETLDSLDLSPDIIKIDVQGAEEMVVEGGLETFERCLPVTIMECPTEKIVNNLSRFGLQAYHYYKGRLEDWKSHTNNVIFLTDAHRRQLAL